MEVDAIQLKRAVETQHGGAATFVRSVPITERHGSATVREGIVYAWSSALEGSDKRRFFAVLHVPPVTSPVEAVRAAIVAEHRER